MSVRRRMPRLHLIAVGGGGGGAGASGGGGGGVISDIRNERRNRRRRGRNWVDLEAARGAELAEVARAGSATAVAASAASGRLERLRPSRAAAGFVGFGERRLWRRRRRRRHIVRRRRRRRLFWRRRRQLRRRRRRRFLCQSRAGRYDPETPDFNGVARPALSNGLRHRTISRSSVILEAVEEYTIPTTGFLLSWPRSAHRAEREFGGGGLRGRRRGRAFYLDAGNRIGHRRWRSGED